MAQHLLAVYYADRKPSAEEFQRLCVDVPTLRGRRRAAAMPMRDNIDLPAATSLADSVALSD